MVLTLIVVALLWWLNARHYEDTDDAFIDTHIVHISPQIAGQVIRIAVNDNQLVKKGQPLVEIDSADARTKLAQVEAQQAQARTQLVQARTQLAQAEASETGAAAQEVNATRDLARYQALAKDRSPGGG